MGHFIADERRLWPAGIIPYEIDAAFTRAGETDDLAEELPAALIRRAIGEWNHKTILRLLPWSGEADYLSFAPTAEVSQSEFVGRNGRDLVSPEDREFVDRAPAAGLDCDAPAADLPTLHSPRVTV